MGCGAWELIGDVMGWEGKLEAETLRQQLLSLQKAQRYIYLQSFFHMIISINFDQKMKKFFYRKILAKIMGNFSLAVGLLAVGSNF